MHHNSTLDVLAYKYKQTQNGLYLFADDANIGDAIRSPTMNADDKTPSSKLSKLKSPLNLERV